MDFDELTNNLRKLNSSFIVERWEKVFSLLPHRCDISKRIIWFTFAYRGNFFLRENGLFYSNARAQNKWWKGGIVKDVWHCKEDHVLWVLKGEFTKD